MSANSPAVSGRDIANEIGNEIGMGHNQGPPWSLAGSWSAYCWRRARRAAVGNPPVEVIRTRKRRAEELGLTYQQYAAILLDRGVRTEALVLDLTEIPAPQTQTAPLEPLEQMARKLRTLRHCQIFAATDHAGDLMDELNTRTGGMITDWARYPGLTAAGRPGGGTPKPAANAVLQPVLDLLGRHRVQPSAAIMIGDGVRARRIAETACLARVFPAAAYFR